MVDVQGPQFSLFTFMSRPPFITYGAGETVNLSFTKGPDDSVDLTYNGRTYAREYVGFGNFGGLFTFTFDPFTLPAITSDRQSLALPISGEFSGFLLFCPACRAGSGGG